MIRPGNSFDVRCKAVGPILVAVTVRTVSDVELGLRDDGLLDRRYRLQVPIDAAVEAVTSSEGGTRQRHRAFVLQFLLGVAQRVRQLGGVDAATVFKSSDDASHLLVKHVAPRRVGCGVFSVSAMPSRLVQS